MSSICELHTLCTCCLGDCLIVILRTLDTGPILCLCCGHLTWEPFHQVFVSCLPSVSIFFHQSGSKRVVVKTLQNNILDSCQLASMSSILILVNLLAFTFSQINCKLHLRQAPNIILIFADDIGRFILITTLSSSLGHKLETTS